ncbi:MAG: hypothetical protein ABJH98_03590 [Reichenbachiella sp.]|uniref:hypothetical protein n=1 Tax=Reichenbachiella sp. TaxID=2184521 RepID=UPI003296A29C
MKLISKISILVAGAILLLHSVLPHEHHDELNSQQHLIAHETANSLMDLIKLAFHFNPGKNHLEEFEPIKEYQSDFLAPIIAEVALVLKPILLNETQVNFPSFKSGFIIRHLYEELRFRGPPQQI